MVGVSVLRHFVGRDLSPADRRRFGVPPCSCAAARRLRDRSRSLVEGDHPLRRRV